MYVLDQVRELTIDWATMLINSIKLFYDNWTEWIYGELTS